MPDYRRAEEKSEPKQKSMIEWDRIPKKFFWDWLNFGHDFHRANGREDYLDHFIVFIIFIFFEVIGLIAAMTNGPWWYALVPFVVFLYSITKYSLRTAMVLDHPDHFKYWEEKLSK